ncbi:MAG TPA: hypothetical protein VHC68_02870 [Candidatus Paceibacterota bacterium]|nr:hypothetical protein [Candidatus Paceibacterota bacterium]
MPDSRKIWEAYVGRELAGLRPILAREGYALDAAQPHLAGERHLHRAVTTESGRKLILLGARADGSRVVIKATSDPESKQELIHERERRAELNKINFAYELFASPRELFFGSRGSYLISVQEFIEQERPYLARPLKEQFAYALGAFKAQEGAHATTYGHRRRIERVFGRLEARDYLRNSDSFKDGIAVALSNDTRPATLIARTAAVLRENTGVLEQYGDFLTHTDFVPHNFRIKDGQIYLLDYSSLRFGNKYEGWARFLNFMALYNPPLTRALEEYVRKNRTQEESAALHAMRLYRLSELIWYYARNLPHTEGDLRRLTEARVAFWADMLEAALEDRELPQERIDAYTELRDALRSEDEKERQKGLH